MSTNIKAGSVLKVEKTHEIETELRCGIIMPIAAMDEYTESHWQDVKSIIIEATQQVSEYKFKTEIVSNSDGEINIIHKNIISNIYNSDVVICDISGRNPNVLFELGMRLTFDKPTIIIKDDQTPYIFDTSSIETLTYPRDLRFGSIVSFKETLATRIKATYQKAIKDSEYSPFLGHFGEFKVPVLNQTAVTEPQQIILDAISALKDEVYLLKRESSSKMRFDDTNNPENLRISDRSKFYDAAFSYIKSTNDLRDPSTIFTSDEFLQYLIKRGVNSETVKLLSRDEMVKVIKDSQKALKKLIK